MSDRASTMGTPPQLNTQPMENNGKYGKLCQELLNRTEADGAVVMIDNGDLGNGFSAEG